MFLHNGWITTCCPNWLDSHKYGTPHNRFTSTPMELWNNKSIVLLRRRILDDDYRACQKCPIYHKKTESKFDVPKFAFCRTGDFDKLPDDAAVEMKRGPSSLYIADSFVCNLSCWSCRAKAIMVDQNEREKDDLLWRVMRDFAPGLKNIDILSAGELFASKRHIRFMQGFNWFDYPNIEISLITNGILIKKGWDKISPAHNNIKYIWLSIDAATKETYEQVRAPAKWDQLIDGIEFINSLRMDIFQMNFVIRADNVHEMAQFAYDMLERGGKHIMFVQLQRSYMSEKAYKAQNVFDPNHPLRYKLIEQLKDPIFHDEKVTVHRYEKDFILP